MKTLSLLLLLSLGLGAAWWKLSYPEGTLEDARRDADAYADRARGLLDRARGEVRGRIDRARDARGDAAAPPDAVGATDRVAADVNVDADADADAGADPSGIPADAASVPLEPPATGRSAEPGLGEASNAAEVADGTSAPDPRSEAPPEARPPRTVDADATDDVRERLAETERALQAAAEREARLLERLATLDERLGALSERLDSLAPARPSGGAALPRTDSGTDSGTGPGTDSTADAETDPAAEPASGDPDANAGETAESEGAAADDGGASGPDGTGDEVALDTAQAEIRTELAELDARVGDETTGDDAPALGLAIEDTRERLATIDTRLQSLPESSAAADSAQGVQDALEAKVRDLERRLAALADADPEIADSIGAVREQVDELAGRGFVTREELREQTRGENVEYKIYFAPNRTDVSEEAARVLDSFIAQEQNRTTGVSIYGFTDRRGSASYNRRLALERATNVRSYLIRNGLTYTKIRHLSGLGEDAAAAVLPDDADDAQQRVVVIYAAQP